jgi:YebC/PmpR family DNA-binding regulatory protein
MGRAHEVRAASMAKTALMKSKKYSKWGKEIFEAAKAGVPDPEMNQGLKNVIAKAKKDQCPADVIKRAIQKAEGVTSGAMKETVYEGMGNGNVAVIVECLTDNVNRTVSSVRAAFTKTGGNFGASASFMFNRKAIFEFEGMSEDEAMEALLNEGADVEDIQTNEDGLTVVTAAPENFQSVKDALVKAKEDIEFETSEVTQVPTAKVDLDAETAEKFKRMLDMLGECEDVQNIYHNAVLPEEDAE